MAAALVAFAATAPARADSPFAAWAAVVVAGDWHAHGGGSTEAFDNARRDVSTALTRVGFAPGRMRQFSARAGRFQDDGVLPSQPSVIFSVLKEVSRDATGGCLLYFTSHGSRKGIAVGAEVMTPRDLARILDNTCGDRLTVVVLSACFSGVFVKPLSSPTRMVLTAARADRASFGCGEADKYPYFDTCFLAEIPKARDFPSLGRGVQDCVAQRERETRASPASEPQLSVGRTIAPMLQMYAFEHAAPGAPAGVCRSGNSTDPAAGRC